jgi:hypothetical protein
LIFRVMFCGDGVGVAWAELEALPISKLYDFKAQTRLPHSKQTNYTML